MNLKVWIRFSLVNTYRTKTGSRRTEKLDKQITVKKKSKSYLPFICPAFPSKSQAHRFLYASTLELSEYILKYIHKFPSFPDSMNQGLRSCPGNLFFSIKILFSYVMYNGCVDKKSNNKDIHKIKTKCPHFPPTPFQLINLINLCIIFRIFSCIGTKIIGIYS